MLELLVGEVLGGELLEGELLVGKLLEVRCEHCLSLFPSCSCKLEDTQVVATVQSPVQ